MKRQRFLNRSLGFVFGWFMLTLGASVFSHADDLVSLDDPAPAPAPARAPAPTRPAAPAAGAPATGGNLESLDGSTTTPAAGGGLDSKDTEVSLDLGAAGGAAEKDFFNPYVFSRNPLWIFLPIFGILIVTLHLLPVPKRKAKRQIDQAKRFFRGIGGDGTRTSMIRNYKEVDPHAAPAPEPAAAEKVASDATVVAAAAPRPPRSATGGRPPAVATAPAPAAPVTEEEDALEIIEPSSHGFEPITAARKDVKKQKGED